ncbi:MAG: 16S rRNA (cytosine(1402)-N(4))-methyltransferase RsmH [Legionella sp.]
MVKHQSVLLDESIEGLAIKEDGVYIDGTYGRGGHTRAILTRLNQAGRLLAIDKDVDAIEHAQQDFCNDSRFHIVNGSFADIYEIASQFGYCGRVNGILLDLGVSSPQIDSPDRGFSFMQSGPLDMRMNQQQPLDAAQFINSASAEEMAVIFKTYGEERFARRIAHAIVVARQQQPISTTDVLAEIIKKANPNWEKHKHPATRVFQAIRIHINQELSDLRLCLQRCLEVLTVGGRLSVISFHSLEDRIVKQFMREQEQGIVLPKDIPIRAADLKTSFMRIGKAIKPTQQEVERNVRARSAVLRIGEKTA